MIEIKEVYNSELVCDFSGKAFAKMQALVNGFATEVAWFGVVEKESDTLYRITDVLVHPQVVSGARVTDADEEYSRWLMQIWRQGDLFERMRLHGHSHVKFHAGPSSIDWANYRDRIEQMNGEGFKIFMIMNKDMEIWLAVLDNDVSNQLQVCSRWTVDGEDMRTFMADAKANAKSVSAPTPHRYVRAWMSRYEGEHTDTDEFADLLDDDELTTFDLTDEEWAELDEEFLDRWRSLRSAEYDDYDEEEDK